MLVEQTKFKKTFFPNLADKKTAETSRKYRRKHKSFLFLFLCD